MWYYLISNVRGCWLEKEEAIIAENEEEAINKTKEIASNRENGSFHALYTRQAELIAGWQVEKGVLKEIEDSRIKNIFKVTSQRIEDVIKQEKEKRLTPHK